VYADWLEERGEMVRAEFIRVECELERSEPPGQRWRELGARQLELIRAHKEEWTRHLKGMVSSSLFRRGFVESVIVRPARFIKHAPKLFGLEPIQTARFSGLGESSAEVEAIAACPELRHVRHLNLHHTPMSAGTLKPLLGSEFLYNLKTLDL